VDQFAQTIASGLTNGTVFALVGVAFALIFNASDVINFAQGEFVMIGGFAYVGFYSLLGNVWVALVLAVIASGLLGAAIYLGVISRIRRTSVLRLVMLTLALSVVIKGLVLVVAGADPYSAPGLTGDKPISVLGATVTAQSVWMIACLALVAVALWLMFNRTSLGLKMVACAVDRRAAAMCGINTSRLVLVSWIISALLAGLAGALVTPIANVTYDNGFAISLNGFAAAALGGVGRVGGALVGGLVLGLANAFAGGYLPTPYNRFQEVVGLTILVVVLVARPTGLLGGRAEARHTAEATL
jgi:branched-chain amino acid transport system permease protein